MKKQHKTTYRVNDFNKENKEKKYPNAYTAEALTNQMSARVTALRQRYVKALLNETVQNEINLHLQYGSVVKNCKGSSNLK